MTAELHVHGSGEGEKFFTKCDSKKSPKVWSVILEWILLKLDTIRSETYMYTGTLCSSLTH